MSNGPLQSQAAVVSIQDGYKRYGANVLLRGLDLELLPGKALLIDGPNGSGKTQLLYALCGLVPLNAGQVRTTATTDGSLGHSAYARDKVCRFVPATPSELNFLPVQEFVHVFARDLRPFRFALRFNAARRTFVRLQATLEEAVGRSLDPMMRTSQLSVGQQKRLQLAAALFGDIPPLALAIDEPLAALDAKGIQVALRLLQTARDRGVALAVAEHRSEIRSIFFETTVTMPFGIETLSAVASGPSLHDVALPPLGKEDAEACLNLEGVRAGYPGSTVFCDRLDLRRSCVALLSGDNGNGKTGLLKALVGLRPTVLEGSVRLSGVSVRDLAQPLLHGRVRYMSQDRDSFSEFRVADALRTASLPGRICDPALLDALAGLDKQKRVSALSSGNLALLSLAQTLAVRPRLALLDEPFANVDAANAARMTAMIAHARKNYGTAFLIVEHGSVPWPYVDRYTVQRHDGRMELRRER